MRPDHAGGAGNEDAGAVHESTQPRPALVEGCTHLEIMRPPSPSGSPSETAGISSSGASNRSCLRTSPISSSSICDNASDDGTIETLEDYARADRRVRLSVNQVNIGSHENMNRVLEAVPRHVLSLDQRRRLAGAEVPFHVCART